MKLGLSHWLIVALAGCVLGAGCAWDVDNNDQDVVYDTGYLSVEWTLAGGKDPAACVARGASGFEMLLFDQAGYFVAEVEVPCDNFIAAIELISESYSGSARLVNADDVSVGDIRDLEGPTGTTLVVPANGELTVTLDFPEPLPPG